ncbi:MAG: MFS transporter [Gammaproteobacteria bacterium]|jgi:MFS family permease
MNNFLNKTQTKISLLGCFIWTLAALFFLYEFFLRTFLGSIVHEITIALKINAEQLSYIDAGYYLTYGLLQIPVGILVDKYGARLLLTIFSFVCALGVFVFCFAHGLATGIIGRFLMGAGSAFAFICLLNLTLNWFPQKIMGFIFGLAQFLGAIGPTIAGAPLVILLYKMHDNWRLVFFLIGLVGILLAILIGIFVRNKPKSFKLQLKFLSKSSSLMQKLITLVKNPQAWWIVLYSAANYVALAFLGTLWGTTYIETRGISHETAAFISSMVWFGLAFGCPFFGAISDIIKRRKTTLIASAILGMCMTLAIIYCPINSKIIFALLFFGLGVAGSGQSVAFTTIAEHVEVNLHATALGFNNAGIAFANTMMIPLITALIQLSFHQHFAAGKQIYHQSNFTLSLLSLTTLFLISLIVAIFGIKETFCRQQKEFFKLRIVP